MATIGDMGIVQRIIDDGGKLLQLGPAEADGEHPQMVTQFVRIYEVIRVDTAQVEWRLFTKFAHDDVEFDPFLLWSNCVFSRDAGESPSVTVGLGMGQDILATRQWVCKTLSAKYDPYHWCPFFHEMESQYGIAYWRQQYPVDVAGERWAARTKLLDDINKWLESTHRGDDDA